MNKGNETRLLSLEEFCDQARAHTLPEADKVLLINFDNTLVAATHAAGAPPHQYLVGGDTTKRLLSELQQAGVLICIAAKKNGQDNGNRVLACLRQHGVAEFCSFVIYNYTNDANSGIVYACARAFSPQIGQVQGGCKPYFIAANNRENEGGINQAQWLGMGLSLIDVSSIQSAENKAANLHWALRDAKSHFQQPAAVQPSRALQQAQAVVGSESGVNSAGASGDVADLGAQQQQAGVDPDTDSKGVAPDATVSDRSSKGGALDSEGDHSLNGNEKDSDEDKTPKFTEKRALFDLRSYSFTFWGWACWLFVPKVFLIFINLIFEKPDVIAQQKSSTGKVDLLKLLQNFFLGLYDFDGLDIWTGEVFYSDDPTHSENKIYTGSRISNWLILASFLGLPSRAVAISDGKGGYYPELTGKELLKNLVGGWDFKANTPIAKFILGALVIPKLIILILKIATWPFKLLINILKIFTQLLPTFLNTVIGIALVATGDLAHKTLNSSLYPLFRYPIFALVSLVVIFFGILEHASRLLCKMGNALTSPKQYLKGVLTKARMLQNKKLAIFFSVVNGTFAVLLSCVMWAITFPLVFGTLVAQFPALMSIISSILQLPVIATSLTWISNLTVVGTLGSALSTIGAYLSVALGPVVVGLASVVGAKVTVGAIFLGIAMGALAAPVAIGWTAAADWASNQWASWHEDVKQPRKGVSEDGQDGYVQLQEFDLNVETPVSKGVVSLIESQEHDDGRVSKASAGVDTAQSRLGDDRTVGQQRPAHTRDVHADKNKVVAFGKL